MVLTKPQPYDIMQAVEQNSTITKKGVIHMKESNFPAIDYSELRGRIITVYGSLSKFAEAIGKTKATVYSRFANASEWTQSEIYDTCKLLGIRFEQIPSYFFSEKG